MKKARQASGDTNASNPIHVLLVYDTAGTCSKILKMFDRISTRLRDETLFKVNAFTFGLLERMDPMQCAAGRAGEPELAVVAFGEAGAPGAAFLSWLENWAERHAGTEAALGFLPMGSVTSKPVRRAIRMLRAIATRHGLGFIYDAEGGLFQEHGTVAA